MSVIEEQLRQLKVSTLEDWAGSSVVRRGKDYVDAVTDLAQTEDDCLAAWVQGIHKYATAVFFHPDGGFDWFCTCPYDQGPCKHVVALLLKAAEEVKAGKTFPLLDETGPLARALTAGLDEAEDDAATASGEVLGPDADLASVNDLEQGRMKALLAGKTKEQLIELVVRLTKDQPQLQRELLAGDASQQWPRDRRVPSEESLLKKLLPKTG